MSTLQLLANIYNVTMARLEKVFIYIRLLSITDDLINHGLVRTWTIQIRELYIKKIYIISTLYNKFEQRANS